ncbi:META domain-containing protein [Pseudidiomarina insulisalsae]|uniref:Secreted protein containing HslJ-like protein n=1 Tax=Pseudidiomarina insulisalsae TaxID=575789 RepID=A0A432YPV4_9GAMM|nr:META domain-containing protein [Pseudidiomarina insulisalsae]RUO63146.1 hypothetical protein CWI71_02680 [Pseudidiomarina insulisalsae]
MSLLYSRTASMLSSRTRGVLRVVTLSGAALVFAACSPAPETAQVTRYHCGALPLISERQGQQLTLSFGDTPAAQTMTLQATTSSSGERYVNAEKGAEFWRKGNEAQFSTAGFSLPLCLQEGTLPQQFSARGNEPFWLVAVDGTEATLRTPGNEKPYPDIHLSSLVSIDSTTFTLRLDDATELQLVDTICYDSMSGHSYPYTATLKTVSGDLPGCAGDTNMLISGASWQLHTTGIEFSEAPSLTFHSDQRVSGFAGCNYLTGSYQLSGEGIRFSPLAVTKRMCGPQVMAFENEFLRQLSQASGLKVFPDNTLQLRLRNGDFVHLYQTDLKLWRE